MKQYKLSHIARAAMLLAVFAMLAACEKPILDDGSVAGGSPADANVVLHFTQSEGSDFSAATRAATDIGDFRMTADPEWDAVNGYTF